ncbi:MAG: 5-formyltetrahydrofolate cyclo-ligase [Treponema sp.]|jgi:5-formyltetrahydrofolate cyclo-ligase|nr:5-formyltetrahydrofolate cyclo-ligase [Treponema sp.]
MQPNSKPDLRAEVTRRLKILPSSQLHEEGAAAGRLLRETFYWNRYETVLLFLSTPFEIDTIPLLEAAAAQGKKIFVPRTAGGKLLFCRVFGAAGPWKTGSFGIREPPDPAEPLKTQDFPALVVVPGLAFDPAGNRLGHGKAYYDRFFAEAQGPCFKIGFCMDLQVLSRLSADPWDVPVDALCTGSRFILIAEHPGE